MLKIYTDTMDNLHTFAETLAKISYGLTGFIGMIFGTTWSVSKLMEISVEAFLVGSLGAFGAASAKYLFEKMFLRRKKKREEIKKKK